MKTINLFLNKMILILFLALVACGPEQGEKDFYKYTVINESNQPIIIKSYLSIYPDVSPIITNLSLDQLLTKTYQDNLPPRGYDFGYFFSEENSRRDSIVVIFNNTKVIYLDDDNDCSNIRNPLNRCEYGSLEEIFIFTEQDYQNAQPCNGNCD